MNTATELLRRALDALKDAKEEISDWGAYADHYFQEKWDYKGSITQYDPLIEEIRTFLAAESEAEPFADSIPKGVLKWNPEAEPDSIDLQSRCRGDKN